jgi:cytochrome c-type biogenesis protein CcsB
MDQLYLDFFELGLVLYLSATAAFVCHLAFTWRAARRIALVVLALAFGMDTVALLLRTGAEGSVAVNSFHDQLSFLAWLIVGAYLLLEVRYHLAVVGALVSPLAFLLTFSAYAVYSGAERAEGQSVWLPAHVAPAFLGYAIFVLAFFVSLLYLLQDRQLKGKRKRSMLGRLPSLETLDELNYRFVAWGFALFTVGIVTGTLLAKQRWGEFWTWEPVQVLSTIAWLLFALLLQTRAAGWRGRKAATLTILGFALLVVSFLLGFPGRHAASLG